MVVPLKPIGPRAKGRPRSKREYSKGNRVVAVGGYVNVPWMTKSGAPRSVLVVWDNGHFYLKIKDSLVRVADPMKVKFFREHFEI